MSRKSISRTIALLLLTSAAAITGVVELSGGWWWVCLVIAVAITPVAVWSAVWTWTLTAKSKARWREWRADRKGGYASPVDILRLTGAWWLRRQARAVRPSLDGAPVWVRWFQVSWRELGTRVVQVSGWLGQLWVYSSLEEWKIYIGGQRKGKTLNLINDVLDAPGAVVATSTRPDVAETTMGIRARLGPVRFFNPFGAGTLARDGRLQLRWDVLVDCEDPAAAMTRAAYLMMGVKSAASAAGGDFWRDQATRLLGLYLHAAALDPASELTILDVAEWVSRQNNAEDQAVVQGLLELSASSRSMLADYAQYSGTNVNTATSATTTIAAALQWLHHPGAAAMLADRGEHSFDAAAFLRARGTIYLIAEDKQDGSIAPFFSAFVGYFRSEAVRLASRMRRGKAEPPLYMALDEAANICPLPLHKLISTSGGSNISGVIVAQSKAQLRETWGDNGADMLWANCATKMIFGGLDDPDELEGLSRLHRVVRDPKRGKDATKPAISAAEIRDLQALHVLVLRGGGLGAIVGRIQDPRERADVLAWQRQEYRREQALKVDAQGPEAVAAGRVRRMIEAAPLLSRLLPARRGAAVVPAARTDDDGIQQWQVARDGIAPGSPEGSRQ